MDREGREAVMPNSARAEPEPIGLIAAMHWQHWLILAGALAATFLAWRFSAQQEEEKARVRFERRTGDIIHLVRERMRRYEDALQAGAAFIDTMGGQVDLPTWRRYATSIGIIRKYPGINGLGVIHFVPADSLESYLGEQRVFRPDFDIHPTRKADAYWPISYIVPVAGNREAVGLDIAHERNRLEAAQRARDTGTAQSTGPIVLAQDKQGAPGFLFFFPFYDPQREPQTVDERRAALRGLIYAPFAVRKLMEGALARERRLVSFSIRDGDELIYDENLEEARDYDANPLFVTREPLEFYGRQWHFEFRASQSFRRESVSLQPKIILIGGIVIDALLFALLAQVSRSSRRASRQAARLQRAQADLSRANDELSQFNYRTSHDLIAPLKTIRGFADLALRDLARGGAASTADLLRRIDQQAARLDQIVRDLLNLCQVDHLQEAAEPVDLDALLRGVDESLRDLKQERGAAFRWSVTLRQPLFAQTARVRQILENLVSNGLKYADDAKPERWVEVRAIEGARGGARIEVEDNGIGIPEDARGRIFDMFFRVGNSPQFGSGLGTYLVKKHVDAMGGSIDYVSTPRGTVFFVDLPRQTKARSAS